MKQAEANEARQPRVLLVEDEALISMLMEGMLQDPGCQVAETAGKMDLALRAAEQGNFDFAIVDVNLAGQTTYPVVDRLTARGVPFVFVTGYGAAGLDPAYAKSPVLSKPFRSEDLARALAPVLPKRLTAAALATPRYERQSSDSAAPSGFNR